MSGDRVIWKFSLIAAVSGTSTPMPYGAQLLAVGNDLGGEASVWALVDPSSAIGDRYLDVRMTGQTFRPSEREVYVGTFQTLNGLVCHVFDLNPPT